MTQVVSAEKGPISYVSGPHADGRTSQMTTEEERHILGGKYRELLLPVGKDGSVKLVAGTALHHLMRELQPRVGGN